MTTQFKSIRDFGYRLAQHDDIGLDFARWAVANIPDLLDLGDENKRLLQSGFLMRKQEITAPAYYLRTDTDKYQPTDQTSGENVVVVDIDYVFSFSQQQYGSFRTKQPGLFAIMQPVRIDGQKYVSGKVKALMRKVSELNPKQRERKENSTFEHWLTEIAESIAKKAKTCRNRGDDTAFTDAQAAALRAAILKTLK